MTTIEVIKHLCERENISISALEKEMGYGNGSLAKAKKIPAERIFELSIRFNVSMDYLMTGKNEQNLLYTCPDCGLSYCTDFYDDVKQHEEEHTAWEKAVEKYGELYCSYSENERIKAYNRNKANDLSISLDERYQAQVNVLRCLFSRSVSASGFDLRHVSFDDYIAMMLNNEKYRNLLDANICQKLIKKYGTKKGINNGESYYHINKNEPQTIAAHFDGSEYTEQQLERIKEFARFIKEEDRRK